MLTQKLQEESIETCLNHGDKFVRISVSVTLKHLFGTGLGQIPISRKFLNLARVSKSLLPIFSRILQFSSNPRRCSPPLPS